MSSLDQLVAITISKDTVTVSRTGFGQPLIAAFHTLSAGFRTKVFTSLAEMLSFGFLTSSPAYLAAQQLVSQNPRPPSWKVGRRDLPPTQIRKLTPTSVATGVVYAGQVEAPDGTLTAISYTVLGGDSVADVTAALFAQFDAITDLSGTDNGTDLDIAADNAGELFGLSGFNFELTIQSTTVDPGIAADLAAIAVDDNDWYGLILDSKSEAEVLAAAAWVETQVKLFVAQTSDTDCLDPGSTTDVMFLLDASAFARTATAFHDDDLGYLDASAMGKQFPKTPGSTTWAYQTLAAVAVSGLNQAQQLAVEGKNGNHYNELGGANIFFEGKVAANEFIDTVRFVDSLRAGMQEDVFATLVANEKIPFTDPGVAVMLAVILGRLDLGVAAGGLAADPVPTADAPAVADVPAAKKVARTLPDITFDGTLAGAIHRLAIAGVVSV